MANLLSVWSLHQLSHPSSRFDDLGVGVLQGILILRLLLNIHQDRHLNGRFAMKMVVELI